MSNNASVISFGNPRFIKHGLFEINVAAQQFNERARRGQQRSLSVCKAKRRKPAKNKKLICMLQHALRRVIVFNMSNALKAKIKQRTDFDNPAGEAVLNLMAAADAIRGQMDRFFATYEITMGQYNVLRILRGAGESGHPRCEIAARMVERAPDITRLVDRLEKQMLVIRDRSDEDRRQSVARISQKGLDLLDLIEPELSEFNNRISQKLSLPEWIALTSLCEKIYAEQNELKT